MPSEKDDDDEIPDVVRCSSRPAVQNNVRLALLMFCAKSDISFRTRSSNSSSRANDCRLGQPTIAKLLVDHIQSHGLVCWPSENDLTTPLTGALHSTEVQLSLRRLSFTYLFWIQLSRESSESSRSHDGWSSLNFLPYTIPHYLLCLRDKATRL